MRNRKQSRDCRIPVIEGGTADMLGAKNASLDSVWFMPKGDIEKAMKEYSIDYCAASFDELYSILKKWSAIPDAQSANGSKNGV